jgi:hypothetical protein
VLAAGGIASCTVAVHYPQKLADGSYQASCNTPLTSCLQTFETLCEWQGYDVIAASERRSRSDLREIPDVTINSDARVRCRQPDAVLGGKPTAAPPPPAPPQPQTDLCREGPNGDRGAHCRELGPLPNPAPAPTSPGSRLGVPTSDRGGVRPPEPGTAAATRAAPFDSWPAGSSPQEVGARAARNYLARPLALGAPMHDAEACTWYGALTTAKLTVPAARQGAGGTSAATQTRYYLDRPRNVGDFHGQAPVLWTASALMRQEPSP